MKFLEWYQSVKECATAYDRHYHEIAGHLFFNEYAGKLTYIAQLKPTDIPIHVERAANYVRHNWHRQEVSVNAFHLMELAQEFYEKKDDVDENLIITYPQETIGFMREKVEKEQRGIGLVENPAVDTESKGWPLKDEVGSREIADTQTTYKGHTIEVQSGFGDEEVDKSIVLIDGDDMRLEGASPTWDDNKLVAWAKQWIDTEMSTKEMSFESRARGTPGAIARTKALDSKAQDLYHKNFNDLDTKEQLEVYQSVEEETSSSGAENVAMFKEKASLDDAWKKANGDMNVYRSLAYQEGYTDEQIEGFVLQKVKDGLAKQEDSDYSGPSESYGPTRVENDFMQADKNEETSTAQSNYRGHELRLSLGDGQDPLVSIDGVVQDAHDIGVRNYQDEKLAMDVIKHYVDMYLEYSTDNKSDLTNGTKKARRGPGSGF